MLDPTPTRRQARTSTTGGAAAPDNNGVIQGRGGKLALPDAPNVVLTGQHMLIKPKFQMSANPSQQGYILPGTKAVAGKHWQIGSIVPYSFPGAQPNTFSASLAASNYGFRFHYNPSSVSVSSPTGFDYQPSQLDTGTPLTAAPSTVTLQTMLNRSEDIYESRRLPEPLLGYSTINDLGTQYDVEWFFRTVNGLRSDQDPQRATADIGLLLATPVLLRLSNAIQYPGYITNMQVDHIKFTPGMVPMVSLMSITLGRFTDAALPLDTTTSTSSTSSSAIQVGP